MRSSASEASWGEDALNARLDAHSGEELMGALPCAVCRYDLQGLSVAGQCPECGTLIRATILYRVDPLAEEFRPLRWPRWTAAGLIVWAGAALFAGLLSWLPHALAWLPREPREAIERALRVVPGFEPGRGGALMLAAVCLSALGMLALVRPVKGAPLGRAISAALGLAAYVPLVFVLYLLAVEGGPGYATTAPYEADSLTPRPLVLRLIEAACIAAILLGARPSARELVRRCLAIRAGRVDRQTLVAMTAAIALAALGDAMRLASIPARGGLGWWLDHVGMLIVLVGSALFTIGLAGCLVDSIRIAKSILLPSPSLRDILGGQSRDKPPRPQAP